jgi:hypothetical protein
LHLLWLLIGFDLFLPSYLCLSCFLTSFFCTVFAYPHQDLKSTGLTNFHCLSTVSAFVSLLCPHSWQSPQDDSSHLCLLWKCPPSLRTLERRSQPYKHWFHFRAMAPTSDSKGSLTVTLSWLLPPLWNDYLKLLLTALYS